MRKRRWSQLTFAEKIAVFTLVLGVAGIFITILSCAFSGFLAPELRHIFNLDHTTQPSTTPTNSPAIPGVPTTGT